MRRLALDVVGVGGGEGRGDALGVGELDVEELGEEGGGGGELAEGGGEIGVCVGLLAGGRGGVTVDAADELVGIEDWRRARLLG